MSRQNRVLLIRPPLLNHLTDAPGFLPPIGLASIAAPLLLRGYEVKIVDAHLGDHKIARGQGLVRLGLSDQEIARAVKDFDPHFVGVSVMFIKSMPLLVEISRLIRKEFKGPIIAGGYAPTSDPLYTLRHAEVDYVVAGEGELVIAQLLHALQTECRPILPGVYWIEQNGRLSASPSPVWESNLDNLPMPAYHLLDLPRYRTYDRYPEFLPHLRGKIVMGILTSRGCPVGCNFCSVHLVSGKPLRRRDPKRVVEEMIHLRDTFGVEFLHFCDDNLTLNGTHALSVFREMIDRNVNLPWATPQGTAAWNWNDELLQAAVGSGMTSMDLPIESGSEFVLHDILHKKPLKLAKLEEIIERARRLGVPVVAAWGVVGSPGETKAEIEKTLYLLDDLKVDYRGVYAATPYPGTDLYRECVEKGLIQPPIDFSRLQVEVGCITTQEFSHRYITARISAWLLRGLIRNRGQNPLKAIRRIIRVRGFWMASLAALLAMKAWVLYDVLGINPLLKPERSKSKKMYASRPADVGTLHNVSRSMEIASLRTNTVGSSTPDRLHNSAYLKGGL